MIRLKLLAALALILALTACRSPIASSEESSKDEPTTEVGLGVHGWPLYERDVLRDGVRTDFLWPISSVRTMGDGSLRRVDLLYPIGHWSHDGNHQRFGVRPLFDVESDLTEKGPVSDWDLLWPLVGWRRAPEESRSHVFPLWWQGSGTDWMYQVVFPLFWRGANKTSRWTHLWPLYGQWSADTKSSQYALWPFFWHSSDSADERQQWTAFWPLFKYGHWKEGGSSRVFPVWWHSTLRRARKSGAASTTRRDTVRPSSSIPANGGPETLLAPIEGSTIRTRRNPSRAAA